MRRFALVLGSLPALVLGSLPALVLGSLLALAGCRHTVEVQAPQEPITINLNVKIEHEIRVKVDRELEDLFAEEQDIF